MSIDELKELKKQLEEQLGKGFVTPPNRAYAVLAIPAKLRIEPIRRRPPNITCTSKHARNAGGIDHIWLHHNSLQ